MSKKSIARQKKRAAALSSTKPCACGSATKQGFRNDNFTGETIAFVKCISCPMKAEKATGKASIDSAGAPDSEWVLIEVITAWNTRAAPKVKPLDAKLRRRALDVCEKLDKISRTMSPSGGSHHYADVIRELLGTIDTGEAS